MGFIEELIRGKQQKEAAEAFKRQRALVEEAKEEQRKALLAQAEEERKKIAREEQERHHKEIEQAEAYFAKSEFPRLAKELALTVGDIVLVKGVVAGAKAAKTIYSYREYPRDNDIHELSSGDRYLLDREVGISLIWGESKHAFLHERIEKEGWIGAPETKYTVWKSICKLITVECDQTGQIILRKSWGDIKLPMSKWLGNSTIQEEALGKAYNNPKRCSEKIEAGRYKSSRDDGWPRGMPH